MREADFQTRFINKLSFIYPDCLILKNDSGYQQGIPDWSFFYGDFWAWFEIKRAPAAQRQPNQEYFIEWADRCSFGAFVTPENEEEVLRDLQLALRSRSRRRPRVS